MALRLPAGFQVKSITFLSPDENQERKLKFKQRDRVLELKLRDFLSMACVVIQG